MKYLLGSSWSSTVLVVLSAGLGLVSLVGGFGVDRALADGNCHLNSSDIQNLHLHQCSFFNQLKNSTQEARVDNDGALAIFCSSIENVTVDNNKGLLINSLEPILFCDLMFRAPNRDQASVVGYQKLANLSSPCQPTDKVESDRTFKCGLGLGAFVQGVDDSYLIDNNFIDPQTNQVLIREDVTRIACSRSQDNSPGKIFLACTLFVETEPSGRSGCQVKEIWIANCSFRQPDAGSQDQEIAHQGQLKIDCDQVPDGTTNNSLAISFCQLKGQKLTSNDFWVLGRLAINCYLVDRKFNCYLKLNNNSFFSDPDRLSELNLHYIGTYRVINEADITRINCSRSDSGPGSPRISFSDCRIFINKNPTQDSGPAPANSAASSSTANGPGLPSDRQNLDDVIGSNNNKEFVNTLNNILDFMSFLVIPILIIMMIVGGIQLSAARDNAESFNKAKKRIENVILALVFYLLLWLLLKWLIPGL